MDIQGRTVLILGGPGLVGLAIARKLMDLGPRTVIMSALAQHEAEGGVEELQREGVIPEGTNVIAEWGDIFHPLAMKDRRRLEVLADPEARGALLDDLYGDLNEELVRRSTLGALLLRYRPEIVIDCVNTATAFAYQNVFASAARLRSAAHSGDASAELVERHLATLYLPQLIRHVQIALDGMRRAGTLFYLKIGTSGTGGMGLNIPFTHSEERPSRVLLSKAGIAGAHTIFLYLMARTPGAPAVKEIKPTTAISWKQIRFGEVRRAGKPIPCFDAKRPIPVNSAFASAGADVYEQAGESLKGVYIDSGENGLFSLGEFETLTALGLMEYITPEEIADDALREIRGFPSGRDVIGALDAATSGPTYRAGVLREVALERMESLEKEHGVEAVAYEMLGPPRLSKLLFEAAILGRLFPDIHAASKLDPDATAEQAAALLESDADLRRRILTIGLPILLPDGEHLLRGPDVKVHPEDGQSPRDPRLPDNGWVDLRPTNWRRWRDRAQAMAHDLEVTPGPDVGSRGDVEVGMRGRMLRPGRLAAWIFRHEDQGERIKR